MPTNIAIGTQENHYMLSVCIITKNEEQNLARCLKSFQNTIVTPHVAFFTDQAVFDMVQCSLESLHQFELGEKVPLEVHAA